MKTNLLLLIVNLMINIFIGTIKYKNYEITKCFGCNLFSHILYLCNKILINKKMIVSSFKHININ